MRGKEVIRWLMIGLSGIMMVKCAITPREIPKPKYVNTNFSTKSSSGDGRSQELSAAGKATNSPFDGAHQGDSE